MNTCTECGNRAAEYFDPRDTTGSYPRLCADCLKGATAERVSELEFKNKAFKETLRKATK